MCCASRRWMAPASPGSWCENEGRRTRSGSNPAANRTVSLLTPVRATGRLLPKMSCSARRRPPARRKDDRTRTEVHAVFCAPSYRFIVRCTHIPPGVAVGLYVFPPPPLSYASVTSPSHRVGGGITPPLQAPATFPLLYVASVSQLHTRC